MSELLLVNPRRRKRRKSSGKRRTMTAKQAKYFAPRKSRKRKSPRRRSSVRASAPAARRSTRRVRRRSRRSFLRNTSGGISLKPNVFIKETLIPSAIGGAGALAVDAVWGMVPGIPANLKTGTLGMLVKAAAAVGIGIAASKVAGKKIGGQVVTGYLTVQAYNLAKGMLQKAMPQITLGEYGMGFVQAGQFLPDQSISAYLEAPAAASQPMGAYLNEYEQSYNAQY